MDTSVSEMLRFSIAPDGPAWRWETRDLGGRVVERGEAGSRREAAAFVIREIIRNCRPALAERAI